MSREMEVLLSEKAGRYGVSVSCLVRMAISEGLPRVIRRLAQVRRT